VIFQARIVISPLSN